MPELLDGEGLTDFETREWIPVERLRQAMRQYGRAIRTIADVEAGQVTFNVRDYLMMPSAFTQARQIYQATIQKLSKKR